MDERLLIDYDKVDVKYQRTVANIESKPHVRYIRYLLSKRYSPTTIKKELHRLGLSVPHEPYLVAYYLCVIDPVVRQMGVGPIYADYKNSLLRKSQRGDYAKNILSYRLHLGDDLDMQVKFQQFIKYIEVDNLWVAEILKVHGTVAHLPVDEMGERILDCASPHRSVDRILVHPKRYLIDKMILENVPDTRIADYMKEKFQTSIGRHDITHYKKVFFNIRTKSIEERIVSLEAEIGALRQLVRDLDVLDEYSSLDLGEKLNIKRQSEQRIEELDDNIKTLNAMYSDAAFQAATNGKEDFLTMFTDVVARGYSRFCQLDAYKDRDVVDPLIKTAKMMAFAFDKVDSIKLNNEKGRSGITDMNSQGILMELYQKRMDEIAKEQLRASNAALDEIGSEYLLDERVNPDLIDGIDELGVQLNFDNDDFNEEE